MSNVMVDAAIEGFLTPFRMVRGIFTLKFLKRQPAAIGYLDETRMHFAVFSKVDDIRYALAKLAANLNTVVTVNRMYQSSDAISVHATVDKVGYLFVVDDNGYQVWKSYKKTSQLEKFVIQYEQLENGSFRTLFKQ